VSEDDVKAGGEKAREELKPSPIAAEETNKDADEDMEATASPPLDPKTAPIVPIIPLNPINGSLSAVYTDGCCGIGHRLGRVVPTLVWANRMGRKAHVVWIDIPWGALFNDTEYVSSEGEMRDAGWNEAEKQELLVRNEAPKHWAGEGNEKRYESTGTVFDRYDIPQVFDDELMTSMLVSMRDSLSPLVRSYLDSVRAQLNKATDSNDHVTLCTHVRQGNNETGDWEDKTWRHIDVKAVLNSTRSAMESFVRSSNATMASVYVASDNAEVRPWFGANIPKHWNLVQPEKFMPKPENGVWFGEWGSKTSDVLNQTMKIEAMAEATAEVFVLGECDALFIPNYSSFSQPSIVLTNARKKHVFFRSGTEFKEMSTFKGFRDGQNTEVDGQAEIRQMRYRRRLMSDENSGRVICDEEL